MVKISRMQFQHKPGSLFVFLIQAEGTVQLIRHEGASRKAEAIAFGQVLHFGERLEEVGTLFFGDAQTPAQLTDDEIMKKDFPNCTHGLIVSLKNVSQSTKWQSVHSNIASWQNSDAFSGNERYTGEFG